MREGDGYHHGDLRAELLRLGLEALEAEGEEELSLRVLAGRAGVSKTAPYRHFRDKEAFLGALADEGNRLLYEALERALSGKGEVVPRMGRAYMGFAVAHPALYRLMNSPLACRLPEELMTWARKALRLLGDKLAEASGGGGPDPDAMAATWGYVHGLVLLRIDGLFPPFLAEPDWDYLATLPPSVAPRSRRGGKGRRSGSPR